MEHMQTIFVDPLIAEEMEKILNLTDDFYQEAGRDATIETFTANFGNGVEVDIKVCNGDPPYVDPVIFEHGAEVGVLDVSESLWGRYNFDRNGYLYIVYVFPRPSYQDLNQHDLLVLLDAYDDYIQNANEQDEYNTTLPISMDEYYNIRIEFSDWTANGAQTDRFHFSKESKEVLLSLAAAYNHYIQNANQENLYQSGWQPVCLNEFWEVEYS